jgi:hypothetical protein
MAVQTGAGSLEILNPIVARTASRLPVLISFEVPRDARLFKRGAATGNETFDRVWSDFHDKLSAPENEDREFPDVLRDHDAKHQLLVAIGKLNYMMEVGGFEDWIAEGFAASTGDLMLKKLPHHNHLYPLLSDLHYMLTQILDAYAPYGIATFEDLERLLTSGPSRLTLWNWFRDRYKNMFRFRGRVNEPYDLESISGKWGHIRLDDEPLTDELVEKYEAELSETEAELTLLSPSTDEKEGKIVARKRADLLEIQAEFDSVLEALHYRMGLQKAWNEFKTGGWATPADDVLGALDTQYAETFTLRTLVDEAAELFNATPDDVYPIEQEGEDIAQDVEEKELPKAASLG